MKKTRLLNSELSYEISKLGHTDGICICDAGLPIPESPKRIDLALEEGVPTFIKTLEVVLSEMEVESAILAKEIVDVNNKLYNEILELFKRVSPKTKIEVEVDHERFKVETRDVKAVVRTGECTPYANIILKSGVVF